MKKLRNLTALCAAVLCLSLVSAGCDVNDSAGKSGGGSGAAPGALNRAVGDGGSGAAGNDGAEAGSGGTNIVSFDSIICHLQGFVKGV